MILSDFHCHTTFVDGNSTPEEMVLAAIEKGMYTLGVSEHAHVPFDPACSLSLQDTLSYREEITRLKEKY
ncbi:MAG: PHP domain-containing protein, partial [Clostridia bacterium]|nr:PHP domain-containing protein [Clostridia bacterium]